MARKTWQWVGVRNEAEARACVLSRLRRRVGLVVVREMARHRLRRVPYIGVPRHIVEERMQPFHLRGRRSRRRRRGRGSSSRGRRHSCRTQCLA